MDQGSTSPPQPLFIPPSSPIIGSLPLSNPISPSAVPPPIPNCCTLADLLIPPISRNPSQSSVSDCKPASIIKSTPSGSMKDAEPSKKKKFPKPLKTNLKLKPRPPSSPRLRKDRTAHNDDSDYEVPEVMPPNPLDDTSSDDADDESANFAESDAPKTDNDIEFNQIPTRRRNKLPGVIDSDNGFNSDNADADGSDSNPNNPDSNSGSDTRN
ncbi:hypothetical protein PtA15_7A108 [Puccinia triticina]|uniref:Histone chaperone domain-containing protein n=1 Tax=Puccinia triticina TaxID=208348 RepID=A0ABY7CUI8_9BASI|nr:uncharacterized protein PtA15_7A108 [Puccinia triticina]WAQ86382.1 hypothetical protein PtA15_7A108 [Puccinia triticina]